MTHVVPAAAAMKMEWDKDVEYPAEMASWWLSCVQESLTPIYFTPNMLEWYVKIICIWDFSGLLRFIKQGIKIIQLFRDPRGLYISQTLMGVNQLGPDCNGSLNYLKYVRNLYKRHKELLRT